jgi:hypothetical protein
MAATRKLATPLDTDAAAAIVAQFTTLRVENPFQP